MVARCHYLIEQPSQYPWWNPWTKEYHILAQSTGEGGKEEEMEKTRRPSDTLSQNTYLKKKCSTYLFTYPQCNL